MASKNRKLSKEEVDVYVERLMNSDYSDSDDSSSKKSTDTDTELSIIRKTGQPPAQEIANKEEAVKLKKLKRQQQIDDDESSPDPTSDRDSDPDFIPTDDSALQKVKESNQSYQEVEESYQSSDVEQPSTSNRASRKRYRKVETWKRTIRFEARRKGEAYTDRKGLFHEAKKSPVDRKLCEDSCRYKCNDNFTSAEREEIFKFYYNAAAEAKDIFLFSCIEVSTPARKRNNATKHHAASYQFLVTVNQEKRRACKLALCNLLSISRTVIDRIRNMKGNGNAGPSPDKRKNSGEAPHNKTAPEVRLRVIEEIKKFPSETSHYSRHSNPNRRYLSPLLSVPKMYSIYCETISPMEPVTLHYFREVFVSEFNLGFGNPRSDVCTVCDKNEVTADHKEAYESAIAEMQKDRELAKSSCEYTYITFDLEKTLPLPKIATSIAFYLRQLWLYNLGIHLVSEENSNGYMHTWTENQAGRGCEEIISALLVFVESNHTQGSHLIAWSDSCAGQNKNFFMVCFWQYLLMTGKFTVIDHKFPEVGHTFLDSDRDFGMIEKVVRKTEHVYNPEGYLSLMRSVKHKNAFSVTDISEGLICAKQLPSLMNLIKRAKNTDGEKVDFRKIRWIKTQKFGFYSYKKSFQDNEEWKEVDIRKPRAFIPDPEVDLAKIKKNPFRRVNKKKVDDIQQHLPYIPRVYQGFYTKLMATDNAIDSSDTE